MIATTIRRYFLVIGAAGIIGLAGLAPASRNAAAQTSYTQPSLADTGLVASSSGAGGSAYINRDLVDAIPLLDHLDEYVVDILNQFAHSEVGLEFELGILIRIATNYAEAIPDDVDGAVRGVEAAIAEYRQQRVLASLLDDPDGIVGKTLTRLEAYNRNGQFAQGRWLLHYVRQENRELALDYPARFQRLLDASHLQARLEFRPQDAANLEKQRLRLYREGFSTLLNVQRQFAEEAHVKGLRYDAYVAFELNRQLIARAKSSHQRGIALNELANVLRALGEMDSGTERLDEAVLTYNAALKDSNLFNDPLDWATSQHNLGYTYWLISTRDSARARRTLIQSIRAYRSASELRNPQENAAQWGLTQNNLGVSYYDLGVISSGTQDLILAIEAFNQALSVLGPDAALRQVTLANLTNATNLLNARSSEN